MFNLRIHFINGQTLRFDRMTRQTLEGFMQAMNSGSIGYSFKTGMNNSLRNTQTMIMFRNVTHVDMEQLG